MCTTPGDDANMCLYHCVAVSLCVFDLEASSVTAVISNLLVDAGMCDVLSPLLGGLHSVTSETAAETYSSSSSMYEPPDHYESHLLKPATPSGFDRDEATGHRN